MFLSHVKWKDHRVRPVRSGEVIGVKGGLGGGGGGMWGVCPATSHDYYYFYYSLIFCSNTQSIKMLEFKHPVGKYFC